MASAARDAEQNEQGLPVLPRRRLEMDALAARLEEFEQRLAVLERGAGPRDDADVDLLQSLYDALGSTPFRPSDVFRFAQLERGAPLRRALLAADVDSEDQLGKLLSRCSTRATDGVMVRRHRRRRHWVTSAT